MTDRPILFSAPMVKALIAGRKTQTRRVLTSQVEDCDCMLHGPEMYHPVVYDKNGEMDAGAPQWGVYCECGDWGMRVRFQPGDRLWVKETFAIDGHMRQDRGGQAGVRYYATDDVHELRKKRPSLFMPRWASRLTLTVTDVRVQRLQEISEEDALAEGVTDFAESCDRPGSWEGLKHEGRVGVTLVTFGSAVRAYNALWDSLNQKTGKRWDDNPWIVACTFRVELRNIDRVPVESAEAVTA